MKYFWWIPMLLFLCSNPALAQHVKKEPGKFDFYVLALSWQPAFCEEHGSKPECQSQDNSRYDATHLVLHGLWPSVKGDRGHSYEFCQVSYDIQEKQHDWCAMPALDLPADTQKLLSSLMPGVQSCLERHEWFRHGSCSGLSEKAYFEQAINLVEHIAQTKLSAYVAANIGKQVAQQNLIRAFEKDFGNGSRRSLSLQCEAWNRKSLLSEVRIYLRKDGIDGTLAKDSLAQPDSSDRKTCKKQIFIDQEK